MERTSSVTDQTFGEKFENAGPATKRFLHVAAIVGWHIFNSILNIAGTGMGFALFVVTMYHLFSILKTWDSPENREKFQEFTKDW